MLQKLRDKTSGWIATVILGLLTVPFAFFGMQEYLFQRNETFVARIEAPPAYWPSAPSFWPVTMLWQRDEVDADEFRTAFEQARQQERQRQGEQFDARAFESADNKRKVLEELIDQHVLKLSAKRSGIAISDAQVVSTIQGIPAFQGADGKFDALRYQQALATQVPPRTPVQFQQLVREGMEQSLVPVQVAQSAFSTSSEIQRMLRLLGEKRDVSFITLPPPAMDAAPVSAAEIKRWYETHADAYRAPETVTIEYVDIDGNTMPAPAEPDEAALRQRYEQEKSHFVQPEQRLASHILIKVDADATPAAKKAAESKAAVLAQQARQPGADFAALARANSDDTGSKAGGGDLGWVEKGVMVKPFEDALFSMQPGEIRGPVKSDFGWHVIQLREVKAGAGQSFEQVRDQLAREQAETGRERAFNDLTGKLVDEVYKNPTTLAPAARLANLTVQRAGPFARGQAEGVIANPAVQRAAFSESLIQDGSVSDPIEVGTNHSVLIRVVQHAESHVLPLAQVSERVVAAIRGDRAAKAAAAEADKLVAELRGGKTMAEVAASRGLSATDLTAIPRGAEIPDAAATDAMFAVPAPVAGKPSPGKAALPGGRTFVFAVTRVIPGDPGEVTAAQQSTISQQLSQMSGTADAESMVRTLRKGMKVTVAEERL